MFGLSESVRTLAFPAQHWRDSTSLHEELKEEERETHPWTDVRNLSIGSPYLVLGADVEVPVIEVDRLYHSLHPETSGRVLH